MKEEDGCSSPNISRSKNFEIPIPIFSYCSYPVLNREENGTSLPFRCGFQADRFSLGEERVLRPPCATRLVQEGRDLYRVQRLLGHKDPKMAQRSAHPYPEGLRDAADVLDSCGTNRTQSGHSTFSGVHNSSEPIEDAGVAQW